MGITRAAPESPRPPSGGRTAGTNARARLQDQGETVPAISTEDVLPESSLTEGGSGTSRQGPATASTRPTAPTTAPASATGEHETSATTPPPAPNDGLEGEPIRRGGGGRKTASLGVGGGDVAEGKRPSRGLTWGVLWRSLSGLAVVLGLMVLGMLVLKRAVPSVKRGGSEAVTVLGRAYVGPKHALHLVKVGRRIIVLGQTPAGMSSVAEISDPEEVEQVTASCQRNKASSITRTFRQLLGRERDAFADLEIDDDELGTRQAGFPDAEADEMEDADEAEQVGLMRQEVDLILDRVRRWRGENRTDDGTAT